MLTIWALINNQFTYLSYSYVILKQFSSNYTASFGGVNELLLLLMLTHALILDHKYLLCDKEKMSIFFILDITDKQVWNK